MVIVPPGGFAGFAQMTPASRGALFPRGTSRGSRKRRSSKRRATGKTRTSKRSRSRTKSKRKLKFGSPAWRKKYMK